MSEIEKAKAEWADTELSLLPIESGSDLKIYAVHGHAGQRVSACRCDKDAHFSVQQGVMHLVVGDDSQFLQAHESSLLLGGSHFDLKALTDVRARLVMPSSALLEPPF